jgi:DNA-binding PadR family transcriptional regulator
MPFGPGFRGRGRGWSGPRRARRGDVRVAILALLAERPMHGYEMIQELDDRTSGAWRPSPGAVYPALQLLDDQGLVRADVAGEKRSYQITDAGREELAKAGDRKPWDEVTAGIAPTQLKLRQAIGPLAGAAAQVMRLGSDAQQQAAADVLNEARRRIYAILAEDDEGGDSAS